MFLISLVRERYINVAAQKGQLGVAGVVADPLYRALLRDGGEIVLSKGSNKPSGAYHILCELLIGGEKAVRK